MYHLFAGAGYYPTQGLGDYQDSYETLEEATEEGEKAITPEPGIYKWTHDWYSVITQTEAGKLEEVASGYKSQDGGYGSG